MYINRIELQFDAAHRLLRYKGKCESPHGHTFKAEIFLRRGSLNERSFLVDFVEVKQRIGEWIESHWDHAFLLNDQDEELVWALNRVEGARLYLFRGENPSTEAMARRLFEEVRRIYGDLIWKVRIWESPRQYAEYVED